jgi:hypothetical protein
MNASFASVTAIKPVKHLCRRVVSTCMNYRNFAARGTEVFAGSFCVESDVCFRNL